MLNKKVWNFKYGFTLAEVLITLGIIGVIGALTIPALMSNIADAQYKTAYKKAYSAASQAWMQAVNDGNILERTDWVDTPSRIANFNAFKSYFKVIKECSSNNNSDCWANGELTYGGYPNTSASAFIDNSGMAWSLMSNGSGMGAELLLDTNGQQKPNKYGQDRFLFYPVAADKNFIGLPMKLIAPPDYNYNDNACPSGSIHPCYYTSWLLGG